MRFGARVQIGIRLYLRKVYTWFREGSDGFRKGSHML